MNGRWITIKKISEVNYYITEEALKKQVEKPDNAFFFDVVGQARNGPSHTLIVSDFATGETLIQSAKKRT